MKARLSYILLCVFLHLFPSCISDKMEEDLDVQTSMQIKFTVDVKAPVATKTNGDFAGIEISSIVVLAYDGQRFVDQLPILQTSLTADGQVEFICALDVDVPMTKTEPVPSYKFVVLTNSTNKEYGLSYDNNGIPDISKLNFSYPFQSTIAMWGVKTHEIQYDASDKLINIQQLGQVDVLRAAAKIGVKLSDGLKEEGFEIVDIKINKVAGSGYAVPSKWNEVDNTTDLDITDAFRPALESVALSDVNNFSTVQTSGQRLIYVPEIENVDNEELAMSITLKNGDAVYEFPYEKGIKFRKYVEGRPTEEMFNIIRNHFYDYTITSLDTELELELIEYETLPWIEGEVEIGGELKFLALNTDLVEIFSKNIDATTLKFTSSSPIKSIVLKDIYGHNTENKTFNKEPDGVCAYYIGKYGAKTQLGTDPGFQITDKEAVLDKEKIILFKISAVAEPGVLHGGITITSPFMADASNEVAELRNDSHDNTIRYLEFEVENEQGLKETFRVMQHPPIVIDHTEGFFSYRDDFRRTDDEEPVHYMNYKGPGSIHLMGMSLVHEHDWTDEPADETYLNTEQGLRSYAWVGKGGPYPWLENSTNNCPPQGKTGERWEEMVCSTGTYNFTYGTTTKTYSGYYRSVVPPTEMFTRERYKNLPGSAAGTMDSKGAAIGHYYQKEVMVDGVPTMRTFRKHYTWNIQSIFWSKYVASVFEADGANEYGRKRLKGQADIRTINDPSSPSNAATDFAINGAPRLYRNHRMYHIKTTTTSDKYVLGRPDLIDENGNPTEDANRGATANTSKNAGLVSPSFALASQLGETDYNYILAACAQYNYVFPGLSEFFTLAERHCREYVETSYEDTNGNNRYDNGEPITHYHDWRLPTKAEIEMIIDFQTNSRAMDRVLIGEHFVCITGNPGDDDAEERWVSSEVPGYRVTAAEDLDGIAYNNTGYYIRCVRDIFEDR